jgi:hypothetical protein
MGSIVAGSTYLIAPPPPKSFSHNHLIASLLCHPVVHPLLLQLQRKDPDSKHALPQFDLVGKRSEKRQDQSASASDPPTRRPREVLVQDSDTGARVATINYINALTSRQKRKAGIALDDTSALAVVYWNYSQSLTKVWTVHRYESKRKGYKVGYEFRLRTELLKGRDGNGGYAYVRWTRKLTPRVVQSRPTSMTSSRDRRSSSVSSSDAPRRRNTLPSSSPQKPVISNEPKWEFSSPNVRRIMASMTAQKLHIHSISSTTSPFSSPSTSDLDEELHSDRELTPGRMMEMLIVSGLFVGLEEDFAGKLRKEFLSAGGLRIPPSDDHVESPIVEHFPLSPKRLRTMSTVNSAESVEVYSQSATSSTLPSPMESSHEPRDVPFLAVRTPSRQPSVASVGYASKGWGYLNSALEHAKGLLSTGA